MKRVALAAVVAALLTAIIAPSIALGTPEPTRRPQRTPRPERTERPDRTPRPTATPADLEPAPLAPARKTLTIGYDDPGTLGHAPLLLAQVADYFGDAGFDAVQLVQSPDVLADLRSGQLDLGVVAARDAAAAVSNDDPTLRAIAGFRNYAPNGTYGGDVIVAAPGLVADEPTTVVAFLTAYIRALEEISDPESAADALASLEANVPSIDPALAETWAADVAVYAPFDGGFGSVDVGGGLGELDDWLAEGGLELDDPSSFIATSPLTIAQLLADVGPNPTSTFAGAPGITDLRIGGALSADGPTPIDAAIAGGHFEDAGFGDVQLLDIEEPLLGLLNGELDLAIIDAETAAEGVEQGLPLVALAGHDNAAGERDVVAASSDLVAQEGTTITAFLIAYLQGLRDIAADPDAAAFAPFDGGFGDRSAGGGLAGLQADLTAVLGSDPDLAALVDDAPLQYAQAWLGLPANPSEHVASDGAVPESAPPAEAEEAG